MRRTIVAIAGLVLIGSTAACGQSSLHSKAFDTPSTTAAPRRAAIAPAAPARHGTAAPPSAAGSSPRTVPELLAAVQRATAAKRTARIDDTGVVPGPHGEDRSSTGGVLSWDGRTLTLDHTTAAKTTNGRTVPDHRILVGDVLYEDVVPGLMGFATPKGRPWLRLPADEPSTKARQRNAEDRALAADLWPIGPLSEFGPAAQLTGTASDPVQGRAATRYDITVDVSRLSRRPAPDVAGVSDRATQAHQPQVHYRVWLGADDLPLRISDDVPDTTGARAGHTVGFSDWGSAPAVTTPDPATVCSARDLHPA